ncbi:MAG: phage holin family protein [Ferruginibacter sp.]
MNFIIKLLITAAVAYLLPHLLSGVHVDGFKAAIIFALILGFLNAIVKPILVFLTLPATIITLGLFLLVINALMVIFADKFIDGVRVDGFWWALLFSILLSVITSFLHGLVEKKKE